MRNRPYRNASPESHSRDRWLISYADLVTLLLGLFIVLYAASDRERAEIIAASFLSSSSSGNGILEGAETPGETSSSISQRLLTNEILLRKTRMSRSEDGVVISLSEAGFFAPGEAAAGAEAEIVAATLAETLRDTKASVRIEGHTDSTPISNAKYPSNWELSTARASGVLSKMIEGGLSPQRLSAAGYAGFRPVHDNATPEGRAQNRRVDIVVLNQD